MWLHDRFYACAALTLAIFVGSSYQQEGQAGVYWLFPQRDETSTYHHNDVVNVTWISPFATPTLVTFCKGKGVDQVGLEQVPGYNASALIKLDFTHADASCWFDLKPDTDGGQGSNSQQFSYVSEVGDSATFGLLSSASEATSTPTSTVSATTTTIETTSGTGDSQSTATRTNVLATTTATTSTSTAPGTTETASASLPVGAQAGIGVGAAVAGVAIAALAVFLFLRRRRQRTLSDEKAHPSGGEHWPPGVGNADVSSHYQPSEYGSSTVYSNTAPVVAPTSASDASKYVFPQSFPPPQAEGYGLPYNTVAQELDTPIHSVHELPTSRYT